MNNKLIDIINSICEKKVVIDEFTSLSNDLSFTSIHFVQLIVDIVTACCFVFEDDEMDLANLDSVGNLNNIVCSHF